ncbi:MAG: pyruvate dehydrogenase, partial [Roseinatronobacter sp.]
SKPAQAAPAVAPQSDGRILASPKLRRVALEQGLDLAHLVRAGHPQPYHMRDLEMLRSLKDAPATAAPVAAQAMRLHADCAEDGFAHFAAWAAEAQGLTDADALLAGLAGASMGGAATVAIERFGKARVFAVPKGRCLSSIAKSEAAPDLRVRDLRMSALSAISMGAEDVPVLTVLRQGAGLALVLECSPAQLAPDAAIALLSEFAGRMHDPLRHLL